MQFNGSVRVTEEFGAKFAAHSKALQCQSSLYGKALESTQVATVGMPTGNQQMQTCKSLENSRHR